MKDVFVYEFLYRGGQTSAPDDDTWHVILARPTTDILGNVKLEQTGALTPEKAAELGFTLDNIVRSLNQRAIETAATIRARAQEHDEALKQQRAKLIEEHATVLRRNNEEYAAIIRQRDERAAELRTEVDKLYAQLAAVQTKKA